MSADSSETGSPLVERREYSLRRLFSLVGVVPLGVFMVVYLWTTANAMRGREAFESAREIWTGHPFAWLVVLCGFWVPFAFHAGFGIRLLWRSRPNALRYPSARNWAHALQRVSAVVVMVSVAAHAWQFGGPSAIASSDADSFGRLCGDLSSTQIGLPLVAAGYLVGLAAVAYHLSNGLYGFCRTWGLIVADREGQRLAGIFGVLGLVLYVIAASTVIYFATGSTLVLAPSPGRVDPGVGACTVSAPAAVAVGESGDPGGQ